MCEKPRLVRSEGVNMASAIGLDSCMYVGPKYDYSILIVPVLPDVVSVADESELISRCIMLLPDRVIGKRGVEPYVDAC